MTYLISILGVLVSTMFTLLLFRKDHPSLQTYPATPPPAKPPSSAQDRISQDRIQQDAIVQAAEHHEVAEADVADLVALADETRK